MLLVLNVTVVMFNIATERSIKNFSSNVRAPAAPSYISYSGLCSTVEPSSVRCVHELAVIGIGGCVYEPRNRPVAIALYKASVGCKPSHDPYFSGLRHKLYFPRPHFALAATP